MAQFKLKSQLPLHTQKELDRVVAISSGLRNSVETAFLAQLNSDYIYNEVLLRNAAGEIKIAQGRTVPTGDSGFAPGAFFTKINASAGESTLYENVGDATTANFVAVGGQIAVVTLSSAQILALNATPVSLISAPGSGKSIVVDEALFKMTFGTIAYTGTNNLELRYTNGSGTKVTGDFDKTAFLNIASGSAIYAAKGVALLVTSNAPVVAVVPTADPGAGDGVITGFIKYHVVTL